MFPEKLKKGDEIRVIAPARSFGVLFKSQVETANKRFNDLGFKLSFSKNYKEIDEFNSSRIESRVADLHEAFLDKKVKAILTVIGGFNSNQLLRHIDYNIIKNNPKIFCGYSDITALQNAVLAKTGLVTYSGPHYSTFGMKKGFEYTLKYFKQCLMQKEPFEIEASKEWSDDPWFKEQEIRNFIPNPGFKIINSGKAEGTIVGGNLCTFNLLQGTELMPSLKDSILFIEDDETTTPALFDRNLQSLLHQSKFAGVKGILVGRFQKKTNMAPKLLKKILATKKELQDIPIITNVDFGHTSPMITFPIGGKIELSAEENIHLKVVEH